MTATHAVETTVTVGEARRRLPELLELARQTRRPFVIVKAGQPQGVVLGLDEYFRLQALDQREQRRQRVLARPPEAAASPKDWQAAFDTLACIRDKAAPLSDDELDALAADALAEIRASTSPTP